MNLLPEVKDELLRGAKRQQAGRRARRRRRLAGLGVAAAFATATGAVAATTGILESGSGPTDSGSYSIRAITGPADTVCLAVQFSEDQRPDGRDPSCTPRPLDGWNGGFETIDARHRLVYGAVPETVAQVRVRPGNQTAKLKTISGAPGRYFDVVIPSAGVIDITMTDQRGQVLEHVDGSLYGPIGRGSGDM